MIQDHDPIPIKNFGGLFGRDSFVETCPQNHFVDSLNTITRGDECKTRDGFTKAITLSNIRRILIYKRIGEADRTLILNNQGKLFDATVSLSTPILNIASMTDFSIYTQYNRCYITPHNGSSGLAGEFVYVYQGSGTARKAAGLKPSSGFTIAASATAGDVESGTHIYAWCYETDSGFITAPGPAVFQTLVSDGTKAVDFSNIPVGPSGTSARRLIASKAIQTYNGDQNGYEMFFVPGGRIANNSATTLNAVSFFDADLQESADYTFDQLEEIPSCLFMTSYNGHACYGNTDEDKSIVYVSKVNEPESINALAGFFLCDPNETEGVKAGVEFQGNLYITKGVPGHTYTTHDNSYEASTWVVPKISGAIGADLNGIAAFLDQPGADASFFVVADNSGLYKFDGTYGDGEFHLAWKIQNWWNRINKAAMNKIQVIFDTEQHLLYVAVPLDSATSPNYILVADYQDGLDYQNIHWHIWNFTSINPVSISVGINFSTKKTLLRVAGYSGNVYEQTVDQFNDDGVVYESFIQFAYVGQIPNAIHHFGGVGLRIKGDGVLTLSIRGIDDDNPVTLQPLTLAAAPGREYYIPAEYMNEKASFKIDLNTINKYFKIQSLNIYTNVIYATRPG